MKNMTALMSCFARAYQAENFLPKIYDDCYAKQILGDDEYAEISKNLENGISFFAPNYIGNDPLKWIIEKHLAPSVLARSAFNERHLKNEINLGLKQYAVLAAGYDTSAYKVTKEVTVFELDKSEMIENKIKRTKRAGIDNSGVKYIPCDFNREWVGNLLSSGFNPHLKTFCSLLGISYYLNKEAFKRTLKVLSEIVPKGSVFVFDYSDSTDTDGKTKNSILAAAAGEKMKAVYSYEETEKIAENCGMLIYENANAEDINSNYFLEYNIKNPKDEIFAPNGICYCLMVKQ